MFAVDGTEGLLLALWLIGVVCAIADYSRGFRGLGGLALIGTAVVIPVVGSLLAVVVFMMDMRGRAHRADHSVTR